VGYAGKIYDAVHRSPIDSTTAFTLMGFSGRSGASATALGSLRQFGLLDGLGERTRISDLALQILQPESASEKSRAIATAAALPTVFQSILERFDGRLPPADEPIKAFLIRDLGFSKNGAEDCISSLRRTYDFVNDLGIDTGVVAEPGKSATRESVSTNTDDGKKYRDTPVDEAAGEQKSDKHSFVRVPLTRECEAELRFSGPVSERGIDTLVGYLQLMKAALATD
jgi:hypothetical protein